MANKIGALRYWCTKVIPLVYDDSLSYYEVLCKVTEKLNEVIEVANAGGWPQEEIEQFVKDSVDEYLAAIDLPSAEDIAQLQTDVDTATTDIETLQTNKANKVNGYTESGKILVTGTNDKTLVESDKSVGDFLEKRTGASGTEFAYTNTNNVNGQTSIDQNAIGNTLAKRYTNGRLKVGAPVDNADAATKQYVDNAVAGATGGIPVIDFSGSYLGGSTSLALYNALNTIGYAIIKNASTVDSSAEPATIVDGLVVGTQTSGGYTFSVQFYMNDENYTVCYQPQAYAVGSNGSITHS